MLFIVVGFFLSRKMPLWQKLIMVSTLSVGKKNNNRIYDYDVIN